VDAIVRELASLIDRNDWAAAFEQALGRASASGVASVAHLKTVDDYLAHIDALVRWAPREAGDSRQVHDKMVEFYFVLDQPSLRALQSPTRPEPEESALTPLSAWICAFARAWGSYLDTPESAMHIDSFRSNPAFHWDEYMPPPSGYLTFNQFFARHVRPGMRPIAALGDARVLVSPADAVFIDAWRIADDSSVYVEDPKIDVKGIQWSIRQLLQGSDHADRFAGGTFMHSALRTYDYHRWHAPVPGTVVEARNIDGRAWLDVEAIPAFVDGRSVHVLHAIEGTGYQFAQTRALVVIDSPHGLVACLPVGMGHVSSVVVTARVGANLHKGEELGYFQFGGSDFVMVFERRCQVELTCRKDAHYVQGSAMGRFHV
jgi:phosphatidylserine decarboxylase